MWCSQRCATMLHCFGLLPVLSPCLAAAGVAVRSSTNLLLEAGNLNDGLPAEWSVAAFGLCLAQLAQAESGRRTCIKASAWQGA